MASDEQVADALEKAAEAVGAQGFTPRFLLSEWRHVVDAWQIADVDAYARVPRLGRKNRMAPASGSGCGRCSPPCMRALAKRGLATWPEIFGRTAAHYAAARQALQPHRGGRGAGPRRGRAAVPRRNRPAAPDALFFAGDLGQRIFQQPFSWKELGIDVRGRSSTLTVNYRTSHQIRRAADRLLPNAVRDVDGNADERDRTVSVFNGPPPEVLQFDTEQAETAAVAAWIKQRSPMACCPPKSACLCVPRPTAPRAAAVEAAGLPWLELSERDQEARGAAYSIGTMHLAKGLEFKAVGVMACDDGVLPLQARMEAVADETELDDVYRRNATSSMSPARVRETGC